MKRAFMVAAILMSTQGMVHACLWDRDTLADEQRGLPEVTAIIVGRYERHTPEFFERRIRLSQAKLPSATGEQAKLLLDDIGVAYDRLNKHAQAIATMQRKIFRYGVDYRAAANMGTFYAHAGDLKNAQAWIRRALKINPEAHFGREWVQLRAVEYLMKRKGNTESPESLSYSLHFWNETVYNLGWPRFPIATVRDHKELADEIRKSGIPDNVLEGILGIIKMGDRDSPEMFGALAQLLGAQGHTSLAIMAYWRAAELTPKASPWHEYWKMCGNSLTGNLTGPAPNLVTKIYASRLQKQSGLQTSGKKLRAVQLLETYLQQRNYAERWRAAYQAHERQLLASGQDPDNFNNYAAFYQRWGKPQKKYEPQISSWWRVANLWNRWPVILFGSLFVIFGALRIHKLRHSPTQFPQA